MKMIEKKRFIQKSEDALDTIFKGLEKLEDIKIQEFDSEKTALIIVDLTNGFTREGPLKSQRVEAIIPNIINLLKICSKRGIKALAFADSHCAESPEFYSFPAHCIAGTGESDLVDELKAAGGYSLIPKNSTNGFLEDGFREWLSQNPGIDSFIVTGDCTDICVLQFSLTLKTYFNRQNRKSNIIVPIDCVDTYDIFPHDADLLNVMSLFMMMGGGIKLYRSVTDWRETNLT